MAKGSLSAFAKPELIEKEKDAFADAMVKKHEKALTKGPTEIFKSLRDNKSNCKTLLL